MALIFRFDLGDDLMSDYSLRQLGRDDLHDRIRPMIFKVLG